MNCHIGRLVLSSLCVGAFGAAGFGWCLFCRLKPAKRTPPKIRRNKSSNTQRTENKTIDVVIHQHIRKILKMDILMFETCWAHNKWNKIASDIKLVFHSSTIAMMHGPINISSFCVSFAMDLRTQWLEEFPRTVAINYTYRFSRDVLCAAYSATRTDPKTCGVKKRDWM